MAKRRKKIYADSILLRITPAQHARLDAIISFSTCLSYGDFLRPFIDDVYAGMVDDGLIFERILDLEDDGVDIDDYREQLLQDYRSQDNDYGQARAVKG